MRLENWYIVEYRDGGEIAYGFVFGSKKFPDGAFIHTSDIVKYDKETKSIQTLNSVYELGVPKGKEETNE